MAKDDEMLSDEEKEELAKKKKKDSEASEMKANKLEKRLIKSLQGQLSILDYDGPKINDLDTLESMIEHYTAKKNEQVSEPVTTPDAKKITVTNGNPSIQMPNGEVFTADPVTEPVFNNAPQMHFVDPMKIPRSVVKFQQGARINYLPPTEETPYPRIIA